MDQEPLPEHTQVRTTTGNKTSFLRKKRQGETKRRQPISRTLSTETVYVCSTPFGNPIKSLRLQEPGYICGFCPNLLGARLEVWKIKRLISVFNRGATTRHFPREEAMREIFEQSGIQCPGIPLPNPPRCLPKYFN